MKKSALLVLGGALLTVAAWFVFTARHPLPEPPPPTSPTRPMPPPEGKPPAGFHIPKVSRISTEDPNPQRSQPVRPEPGLPPVPNIPPGASHSILESLALITDNGPGASYRERIEAVHRLGKDLPAQQVRELMDFIAAPLPPGTAEVEFRRVGAIKNEVLDTLLAQQSLPEGIGELLIAMAANPVLDDLWRDYCIQRFVRYYDRKYPESPDAEAAPLRDGFLAASWSHATGPVTERTGTALLSLERLSARHAEVDRQTLARTALAVAAAGDAPVSARIPALQVAARLGEGKAAALARELVESEVTTTLKLSALATLGEAGTSEDLPLLARVLEHGDKHLHKAATEAKGKLEKRLAAAAAPSAL